MIREGEGKKSSPSLLLDRAVPGRRMTVRCALPWTSPWVPGQWRLGARGGGSQPRQSGHAQSRPGRSIYRGSRSTTLGVGSQEAGSTGWTRTGWSGSAGRYIRNAAGTRDPPEGRRTQRCHSIAGVSEPVGRARIRSRRRVYKIHSDPQPDRIPPARGRQANQSERRKDSLPGECDARPVTGTVHCRVQRVRRPA